MRRPGRAFTAALIAGVFWIGLVPRVDAQQPLRIGASLSQTGPYANLGQNQFRGDRLCVKHANEKGGVLGRRIELLVEDDQSEAPTAVAIYEKLITQDKVDAILGPYRSDMVEAVADVSEKHKMPMVAASGSVTSIYKKGRHSQDGPEHRLRRVQGGLGRLPDRAQDGDLPAAGRQEGDRLARGAAAGKAHFPTPPWRQR